MTGPTTSKLWRLAESESMASEFQMESSNPSDSLVAMFFNILYIDTNLQSSLFLFPSFPPLPPPPLLPPPLLLPSPLFPSLPLLPPPSPPPLLPPLPPLPSSLPPLPLPPPPPLL